MMILGERAKRLLTFEKYSSEWDKKLTYGTQMIWGLHQKWIVENKSNS